MFSLILSNIIIVSFIEYPNIVNRADNIIKSSSIPLNDIIPIIIIISC